MKQQVGQVSQLSSTYDFGNPAAGWRDHTAPASVILADPPVPDLLYEASAKGEPEQGYTTPRQCAVELKVR